MSNQAHVGALTLHNVTEQPYDNMAIRAGLVTGHDVDTIYFELAREDEEPIIVLLRTDEALALLWALSGALWSEQMGQMQEVQK